MALRVVQDTDSRESKHLIGGMLGVFSLAEFELGSIEMISILDSGDGSIGFKLALGGGIDDARNMKEVLEKILSGVENVSVSIASESFGFTVLVVADICAGDSVFGVVERSGSIFSGM